MRAIGIRSIRRQVSVVAALAALTVSWVAFAGTPGAGATDGDPALVGEVNFEESPTSFRNTLDCPSPHPLLFSDGLFACGGTGIIGQGVVGGTGVEGIAGFGGNGVLGRGTYAVKGVSSDGWGVWGEGKDRGVYGISDNAGVVAFGNNVGVQAESPTIALRVKGKAEFSRSGTASVAGTAASPKNSVRVTVPITAKSLMTATLQKFVSGVWVVAAVPNVAGGYFTIFLNKQVTTNVGPIAWQIIERP